MAQASRPVRPERQLDITGERYGALVAVSRVGSVGKGRNHASAWLCRCDCGRTKVVRLGNLRSFGTTSCGQHKGRKAQ